MEKRNFHKGLPIKDLLVIQSSIRIYFETMQNGLTKDRYSTIDLSSQHMRLTGKAVQKRS